MVALIGTLVIASQANQDRALVLAQLKSVLPQGKRVGMVGQLRLFGLEFPFSITHLIQARTALLYGPGNGIENNHGV
jgi:hypothetical protein